MIPRAQFAFESIHRCAHVHGLVKQQNTKIIAAATRHKWVENGQWAAFRGEACACARALSGRRVIAPAAAQKSNNSDSGLQRFLSGSQKRELACQHRRGGQCSCFSHALPVVPLLLAAVEFSPVKFSNRNASRAMHSPAIPLTWSTPKRSTRPTRTYQRL